jgi:hypothetical protein
MASFIISLKAYRTPIVIIIMAIVLLIGLLSLDVSGRVASFSAFALALSGFVVSQAGRSSVEQLANGGGISGAAKVLLTPRKPEEDVMEEKLDEKK